MLTLGPCSTIFRPVCRANSLARTKMREYVSGWAIRARGHYIRCRWLERKKKKEERKKERGEASRKEELKCKIPMCLGQSSVNYNARQRSKVIGI